MSSVKIEIEEPLAAILHQTNQPVQQAGREMIVLELYRRGTISSGKAAGFLSAAHRLHPARLKPRDPVLRTDRGRVGGRDDLPRVLVIVVVADASPLIALQQIDQRAWLNPPPLARRAQQLERTTGLPLVCL